MGTEKEMLFVVRGGVGTRRWLGYKSLKVLRKLPPARRRGNNTDDNK